MLFYKKKFRKNAKSPPCATFCPQLRRKKGGNPNTNEDFENVSKNAVFKFETFMDSDFDNMIITSDTVSSVKGDRPHRPAYHRQFTYPNNLSTHRKYSETSL